MNKKYFQEGEFEFTFPENGDKYKGHYCAHVSGLAWREGKGVYQTHDGQLYEGIWKDDKLDEKENVHIIYQNHDEYDGKITKYKYAGPGTYTFQNGGRLVCNFEGNKPTGDVIHIDHRDGLWYGKAEADHVFLFQEHIFSYELDSERGKGCPKYPILETPTELAEEIPGEDLDLEDLKKIIFAKSTKTPSDFHFEDSDWYRNYLSYNEMHDRVMAKIDASGTSSLDDDEKSWYKLFLKSQKLLQKKKDKVLKKKHSSRDLIRDYLNEELKNTCSPIHVFYPRPYEEVEGELEQQ